MNKWLAVLCSVLALGLVAAGCGGSDNKSSSGGGGTAKKKQKPSSAGGGGGGVVQVTMKNIQFQPTSVTVKKGQTVKWTNNDSVGHDVTKKSGPGPKFSSGKPGGMQSGDTFQQKFNTVGTIKYVCTIHAAGGMNGTVTVK